jgi:endonuclease/exonuclease/phosphatase family metal-dependent hydrolase
MQETTTRQKKRKGKWILILIGAVLGIIFGWYLVVRLLSPWNAVKVITLNEEQISDHTIATQELRVGCYNIASGRGGRFGAINWDGGNRTTKIERVKQMGALLKEAQLDIVVLNEVDFSSFWSGHFDQAKVIAQEAGYSYLVEQRNIDAAIPFCSIRLGNAVLSRYPIAEARFVKFPNPSRIWELFGGDTKYGLVCTINLPHEEQVRVFAVHLTVHGEALRVESVRKILEVQQESDIPLIVMGDFNAAPTEYPHFYADEAGNNAIDVLLASKQLTTLPLGPLDPKDFTFPSENPDRVIDWIFVSPPWQLTEKKVLLSDLSDHLPVIARLTR